MAIPTTPTLDRLCRTALRRAGQPAPSSGMIQEAMNDAFMEVKNDIKMKAATHPLLETEAVLVTVRGVRKLSQPTDAHQVKSVLMFDGPDDWRGTAQTGASGSITLASTVSEDEGVLVGKPIFTLSGTGSLQYRHISGYTNSTKVATVSPNWTTTPDSSTTYLVANSQVELLQTIRQVLNYDQYNFATEGVPCYASLEGEVMWMDRPPDAIYPTLWTYYMDIDQLDESGTVSQKILREWRSLLTQGITAYSMDTYDDTRANDAFTKYHVKLQALAMETLEVQQTRPYDPIVY